MQILSNRSDNPSTPRSLKRSLWRCPMKSKYSFLSLLLLVLFSTQISYANDSAEALARKRPITLSLIKDLLVDTGSPDGTLPAK